MIIIIIIIALHNDVPTYSDFKKASVRQKRTRILNKLYSNSSTRCNSLNLYMLCHIS